MIYFYPGFGNIIYVYKILAEVFLDMGRGTDLFFFFNIVIFISLSYASKKINFIYLC